MGDETAGKLIRVRDIVRHPSYKPPAVYADLALLELDEIVKFGAEVKPACLYTEFDSTPLQVWATGWGITGIGEYFFFHFSPTVSPKFLSTINWSRDNSNAIYFSVTVFQAKSRATNC